MEFHLHGKHYKLYNNEGSILNEEEPKQQERREEAQERMERQNSTSLHPRSIHILS